MNDQTPRCRYVEGKGRLTSRHVRDCNTSGCEGCEPCRDDHCGMPGCSRHLRDYEPLVCTRCVGEVRENLDRIVQLCTLTPFAAAERGRTGTLAEVLAGPVPEVTSWNARFHWLTTGAACRCAQRGEVCPDTLTVEGPTCKDSPHCKHTSCHRLDGMRVCPDFLAYIDTADDELHPLFLLGTWDLLIAEHLEHNRTLRVTVPGAAAYIKGQLTDLARDEDFAFDQLAKEVKRALSHIEDALSLTIRVTEGAPCPACRDAGRKPARRMQLHYAEHPGGIDEWVCPTKACGKRMGSEEYERTNYRDYLANAERLTAAQMRAQYRVAEGTLRRWANGWWDHNDVWHPPTVRKHGYDGQRRQLYDVADVKRMRDSDAAVA